MNKKKYQYKIEGCIDPQTEINDFVVVIFTDNENKNYYIQKYNNDNEIEYISVNVEKDNLITKFQMLEELNYNELILGYLDEKNNLTIGNKQKIKEYLLPILTNDSIYPFQRYIIADRLEIPFMARKLYYDSIEYFDSIKFPVDLTYEKYHEDFLLITSDNAIRQEDDKLISKLKETLTEIKNEMDKYGYEWNDYFNPNEYPLRIDKYKISENAIQELHDLLKPIGLFKFISNPYISFKIDNSFNDRLGLDIENTEFQNNNKKNQESLMNLKSKVLADADA